jgi:prophage regulatory protein
MKPERLLRLPQVQEKLGLSRAAIYARIKPLSPVFDATFPAPVRLGARHIAWKESALDAWIAAARVK